MEETLLGQKQIRQFLKQFSQQQWNRVAKATMMIGIQSLMKENKNHQLFWDFSHLSIEELEDIVVENEVFLIQRARQTKSNSQSRNNKQSEDRKSKNYSQEREQQNQTMQMQKVEEIKEIVVPKMISKQGSQRRQAPFYTDDNETVGKAEIARKSSAQTLIKQEIEPKKQTKKVTVVENDQNQEIKTILKPSKNQQQDFNSMTPQISMEHHNQLMLDVEQALQVKNELDNFLRNEKAAQTNDSLDQEVKYIPVVNSMKGAMGAHQIKTTPNTKPQAPQISDKNKILNNGTRQASQGRHQPVFNKHKSSSAMNLLLKADEALSQKQIQVSQVLKNQKQPSQRKANLSNQRENIHQITTKIGQEKFIPSSARQQVKIENLVEQNQDNEQQRKASRSPSYGRPSSKWRTGMTQEEIQRAEEESVRNALEKKQQNIKYPKWWQNYQPTKEELEKEERKGQAKRSRSPEQVAIVQDPARAKVHKTLGRYAEDSLDARLRQVHANNQNNSIEQALQWQSDLPNNHNYNTINMSGIMPPGAPAIDIISGETNVAKGKKRQVVDDNFHGNENLKNSNFLYHSNTTSLPSLQGSSSGLHGYQNGLINSSNKQKNIMDSTYGQGHGNKNLHLQMQNLPQPIHRHKQNNFDNQNQQIQGQSGSHLSKTQGSMSSFAYTSGKGYPKYSPARAPNPGSQNVPMSYAGPPTTEEMKRDAHRHISGNRNFSQTVSHDELPFAQTLPKRNPHAPKFSFDGSAGNIERPQINQNSKDRPYYNQENRNSFKTQGSKAQLQNNQNAHLIYLEQQKEAERNRKRVQQSLNDDVPDQVPAGFSGRGAYGVINADLINEESQNSPSPDNKRHLHDSAERNSSIDGGNMRRYAKGGMAITINLTGSQSHEENRSNSKPRYPFMDQEPFHGNEIPTRQRNSIRKPENQASSERPLYKSKQFQQVGSSIKQIIDQDKRNHQERQLQQTNQDSLQNSTIVEESSVSAQIFYKKDNSKVIYSGDDSYRNPYYDQRLPQFRNKNDYYQQENIIQEQNPYKRNYQDLGPQSEIENGQMIEVQLRQGGKPQGHGQWAQNQIHSDFHNETAFSKKLMMGNQTQQTILHGQNRINGSQAYDAYNNVGSGGHGNYLPDSSFKEQSSQQDDENSYVYRGEEPVPPHFSNGFYDERGNYHHTNQPQYVNSQGRGIGQWQDQIRISEPREMRRGRDDENTSEGKNNTSRFAFQSQDEGIQSNHNLIHHDDLPGQYNPQIINGQGRSGRFGAPGVRPWHGGQNSNSYRENDDQSSLITPNASQGARGKLQNQLEQVLMMRSGDFSAGGNRDNDGLLRSVGGSIANVGEHSEVLDDGRYYQQHNNYVNANQDNRQYQSLTSAPINKQSRGNLGYQPSSEGRNYGSQAQNSNNFNTSQFANINPNELESADRYHYNQGISESQEDYQRQVGRFEGQQQQQYNHQYQKPQHNGNNFTLRKTSDADPNTDFRNSQGKRIPADHPSNYYVENERASARQSQASSKNHLQQNQLQNMQIPELSPHSRQSGHPTHHRIGSGKSNRLNNEIQDPMIQKQKIPNYQQKQTQNYATFNEGNLPEDVRNNYRSTVHNFQENDRRQMLPSDLEIHQSQQKSRTDPNALRRDGTYEPHQFVGSQIGGESELDTNMKTENLRQFMEFAQPADGLMQSQITSGLGQESIKIGRTVQMISEGLPSADQHKISTPVMGKASTHLQPSNRTHENEGGSLDDPAYGFLRGGPMQGQNSFRGNNNYAGLNHEHMNYDEDRAYRDITDESSPAISNTDNNSPDQRNYPNDGQTYDDDYISSSLQETPQNEDLVESSGVKKIGNGSSNQISGRGQQQIQGQDYTQNIQKMTQQAERLVDQLAYMRHGQNFKQPKGMDSHQQNDDESSLSPLRDSDL